MYNVVHQNGFPSQCRFEALISLQRLTPYLTLGQFVIVNKTARPLSELAVMEFGNKPSDGGHLLFRHDQKSTLGLSDAQQRRFTRRIYGSDEFISCESRYCIWIEDEHLEEALCIPSIAQRIDAVRELRLASPDKGANALAKRAHQLKLMRIGNLRSIIVPIHTSENRDYLPVGLLSNDCTISNAAYGLYDAPLWNMA